MSSETNVETKTEEKPVEEKPVEGTPTPEAKPIDERALSLAEHKRVALEASTKAEGEIEAAKTLAIYAKAGNAHVETVRCWKASIDYACEKRGVASSWSPAEFDSAISQITIAIRASNPELFENFEHLNEKASNRPSKANERISTRLRVGIVYNCLVSLMGEKAGQLPYRLAANYLATERILKFSKQDVDGVIREEHAEFLKTQLGLLIDGKSSNASFLNGLNQHFVDVEKAAADKAASHLTPAERLLRESAKKDQDDAEAEQAKISKVREGFAKYMASALVLVSPDEIATMITSAAKKANKTLPIGQLDPAKMNAADLKSFLELVSTKGGASTDERKQLRETIMQVGNGLAELARKRHEEKQAKKAARQQPAMANA